MRVLFPDVEADLLDAIIPLLTEGKFSTLKSLLTSINETSKDGGQLPLALFQGIGDFVQGDEDGLVERLRDLIEDLFAEDEDANKFKEVFLMLFDTLRLDPFSGI